MKTKDVIYEAFYSLCKTDQPDKISVNSIIRKSGINRSTFYYYFVDKNELILTLQEKALDSIFNILLYKEADRERLLKGFQDLHSPEACAACFHIKENVNIYKIWFNDFTFIEKFTKRLYEYLLNFSSNQIHCTYFAYGTLGYFTQWIRNDCIGDPIVIANQILQISTEAFSHQYIKSY